MIVFPFANQIGPYAGPAADGVLLGSLPRQDPVSALVLRQLQSFSKVYRGNTDAAGAVTYSDVTAAANNDTTGDTSLFDTVNPTSDRLCVEVNSGVMGYQWGQPDAILGDKSVAELEKALAAPPEGFLLIQGCRRPAKGEEMNDGPGSLITATGGTPSAADGL